MGHNDIPPLHWRWIAADIVFGVCSTFVAFESRHFALLFLTAASIWFLVLFALYARWWQTRDTFVAGRRKFYRGVGLLTGFLIALLMYYFIVWLDPTLR